MRIGQTLSIVAVCGLGAAHVAFGDDKHPFYTVASAIGMYDNSSSYGSCGIDELPPGPVGDLLESLDPLCDLRDAGLVAAQAMQYEPISYSPF